ncbi:Rab6 GTPase activator GAPCenA and related TBC domain proteins [Ceraceosorus bombacis]|uniref:Rab6 GTPase activator GAPCenA and related TBC domain proteins n=1 Tax=Ceraceosorus bombacis TaxID=401625 RepID=A0A0P1BKH1_9BASI|nr:Rab6 GTPase activator GAPCenA and related TBC domain proteins [Ceraceosorus bombacis]
MGAIGSSPNAEISTEAPSILGAQTRILPRSVSHNRAESAQSRPASAAGPSSEAAHQPSSSLRPLRLVASSSNISPKLTATATNGRGNIGASADADAASDLRRPAFKREKSASAAMIRSRAASPAPSAAESWTQAGDAEGAYIRKTYAHFDSRGVEDDGFVEGQEWTRERGQGHAWEQPDLGRKRNISRARSVTPSVVGAKLRIASSQLRRDVARSVPSSPSVGHRNLALSPAFEGSSSRQILPGRLRPGPNGPDRLSPILAESSLESDNPMHRAAISPPLAFTQDRPSLDPIVTDGGGAGLGLVHSTGLSSAVEELAPSPSAPTLDIIPPTPNPALSPTQPLDQNAQQSGASSTLSPRDSSHLGSSSTETCYTTVDHFSDSSGARRPDDDVTRPFSSESIVSLARSEESGLSDSRRLGVLQGRVSGTEEQDLDYEGESHQEREARIAREEVMSSIDRYGFFAKELNGSSSRPPRTTILPAPAFAKLPLKRRSALKAVQKKPAPKGSPTMGSEKSPSLVGASGFAKGVNDDASAIDRVRTHRTALEEAVRAREALRVEKWQRMLRVDSRDAGGNVSGYRLASNLVQSKKLRRRIYKGVPDRWRSAAWWALVCDGHHSIFVNSDARPVAAAAKANPVTGHGRHESERSNTGTVASTSPVGTARNRSVANGSLASDAEHRYAELIKQPSPHDVQIDLDVPRTISGHVLFHTRYGQGQRGLFHVLHAFSLHCDDCAYCQGMGPIAATLLVYLPPERAYACLTAMHDAREYGLHKTFSPGFPGLVESFYVQEQLALAYMPDIARQLLEQDITTSSYATRWYITLFANVVPFQTQIRLWDALLLDGADVLVIFSLAVLWALRDRLIHPNATFETILGALGAELLPEDDDALMRWVEHFSARDDVKKKIAKAHKEWHVRELAGDAHLT